MIICTDAANNRTDALRPEDTNDTDPTTWDEEMGGWAASSRTAASDDAQLSPPGPNKRSLGQLRAIQWPPRAPRVVAKNAWRYAKSVVKPLEIVFWALLLLFIHGFLVGLVPQNYRPPPYQTTINGDIVLDMAFDRHELEETFPGPVAFAINVFVPLAMFWLVGNFLGPSGDAHAAFCTYLVAMEIKIFLVETVKCYVGYWRPYFYSRFDFDAETLQFDGPHGKPTEPWGSFPSGHAATAMVSMTLLALYLVGKVVGITRRRAHSRLWSPSFTIKLAVLVAASPMVLGIFISVSRIRDDWHHPADVLAGMELGVATAVLAHKLYYPSEWGEYAGIPRATIAETNDNMSPQPEKELSLALPEQDA